DAVTAVAARYLDLARSYGTTAPARLCHHGIDLDEWRKAKDGEPPSRHAPFTLVYLGAMGASYDLETAIDAVAQCPDATLDIAGSGPKEAVLRARAAGCPRIRFHGFLGDAGLRALLARCDVGLVPMLPESCVGVPYKLADYAAAGLRVAECLGGETQALVGRFHAGAHYAPRDPASLQAALAGLAAATDPAWNPAAFAHEFDASRIMAGYAAWLEGLVVEKRNGGAPK
ncbi:MAG: glycosyltransferase, partial [Kiritimatiellae bacterium]|nr:glycosyltransferase [Kiritimatiellia bacterium]